jgi:signal transduction histidine kinase
MDIRTRLHISNVVMIVVPVVITLLVGAACVAVVWGIVSGWAPMHSDAIEETLKHYLGLTDVSMAVESFIKSVVAIVAVTLLLVIVVAVILTDRFMTKFVLAHVTQPLDRLSAGVEQIREGNLDYRIGYGEQDEFKPVCDAFDEMADRLEESVERDRRDEATRKRLIAGISHDLRSPLTSVRGYAEGLRDGVATDEATKERYLGVIVDKTAEIERRISQLLTMTKLDMDEYPVNLRPVRLDCFVHAFLECEGPHLRERGMDVTSHLDCETALADTNELERILDNVLENSLLYRTRDRVAVRVSVTGKPDAVELSVEDDGPGVPDEDLERVFDVLYRGDVARSKSRDGSGLGLSIVAASVARMRGTVRAERSQLGGLAVVVCLPRATADSENPEQADGSDDADLQTGAPAPAAETSGSNVQAEGASS